MLTTDRAVVSSGFLVARSLPAAAPAETVPAATPEPGGVIAEVAAANARNAERALRHVGRVVSDVAERRHVASSLVGGVTAGLFAATGVVALSAIGIKTAILPMEAVQHPILIGLGGLLAGCVACAAAIVRVPVVLRERAVARKAEPALTDAERYARGRGGLEEAWIAWRAQAVLTDVITRRDPDLSWAAADIFPHLASSPFGDRLAALAKQETAPTPEVQAQLGLLESIYRALVWGDVDLGLERIICSLEKLTPAARALLPEELKDVVLGELGADHGNTWRIGRFLQALAGERRPYSTAELDCGESPLTLSQLREARRSDEVSVHDDAAAAARALTSDLALSDVAQALVKEASVAETVAAHFEREGFRATLYRHGELGIVLTVYDLDDQPYHLDVKGAGYVVEDSEGTS